MGIWDYHLFLTQKKRQRKEEEAELNKLKNRMK